MKPFFLLGAQDPEMDEIEALLQKLGLPYAHAMAGGARVHPGNAYGADPMAIPSTATVVFVECAFRTCVVDHHRPSDPAYSLGPDAFFEASSLGQVIKLLSGRDDFQARVGWTAQTVPERLRYIAAIDHCFNAAQQGRCPGIVPGKVAAMRVQSIAKTTGKSVRAIGAAIGRWRKRKEQVPIINLAGQALYDFTAFDCGLTYSAAYLSLQQASGQDDFACMLRCRDTADGPVKWHASGLTPEAAQAFKETAPSFGLSQLYGVPARGYAGGYFIAAAASAAA